MSNLIGGFKGDNKLFHAGVYTIVQCIHRSLRMDKFFFKNLRRIMLELSYRGNFKLMGVQKVHLSGQRSVAFECTLSTDMYNMSLMYRTKL